MSINKRAGSPTVDLFTSDLFVSDCQQPSVKNDTCASADDGSEITEGYSCCMDELTVKCHDA